MSDKREQTIATLTEHLTHWKRLLSEGICTKDEGERTIDALNFAIESIKVDRAYDLAYEKVDFIEIPDNATNGDMIKAMFPNEVGYGESTSCIYYGTMRFDRDWWNSSYKR